MSKNSPESRASFPSHHPDQPLPPDEKTKVVIQPQLISLWNFLSNAEFLAEMKKTHIQVAQMRLAILCMAELQGPQLAILEEQFDGRLDSPEAQSLKQNKENEIFHAASNRFLIENPQLYEAFLAAKNLESTYQTWSNPTQNTNRE